MNVQRTTAHPGRFTGSGTVLLRSNNTMSSSLLYVSCKARMPAEVHKARLRRSEVLNTKQELAEGGTVGTMPM